MDKMADRNNPPNVETIQVSPTSGDKNDSGSSKADSGSSKHRGWTAEWDLTDSDESSSEEFDLEGEDILKKFLKE